MSCVIFYRRNRTGITPPASLVSSDNKKKNLKLLENEHKQAVKQDRKMKFPKKYGSKQVKSVLKEIFYDKCAYCEQRISSSQFGDVEHFRPKSVYWWLALTWENLLLACEVCNTSYKSNNFPVNGRRATKTSVLNREKYLLLDPLTEDPEEFIKYDDAEGVVIEAINSQASKRVDACIEFYGLNREKLVDERKEKLMLFNVFLALYQDSTSEQNKNIIRTQFRKMESSESEFAGLIRYHLKQKRINV